ncbi:hypothetical protein HPB52_007855 [Rhipicephalus sanguineus]|uniref:Carboxylesterase type B domain-containing protein n=1 Tax=Rhipicephalus sanguineus TaxID=34632 RepID=A0A9D4PYS7_RHISA|nr:hypothetical protein HPB52_007855 [Rhipicephalus sanguineus]
MICLVQRGEGKRETASDGAVKWAELAADINGVVVAPNHRLGVFGFLDVGVRGMLGNVALQDVLLAMSWVDKNAGALNVDTDNMAAFGLGSGAYVLSLLLMSSSSANDTLFRRAFLQCPEWRGIVESTETAYFEGVEILLGSDVSEGKRLYDDVIIPSAKEFSNSTNLQASDVFDSLRYFLTNDANGLDAASREAALKVVAPK